MTEKKVTNRHRAMMDDIVLEGMKNCEVAAKYDISDSQLSLIRNTPLWRLEEEKLRGKKLDMHRQRIVDLVPKALDALEDTVDSGDEKVRLASAKEILSRGGLPSGLVIEQKISLDKSGMEATLGQIQARKAELIKELGYNPDEDVTVEAEVL